MMIRSSTKEHYFIFLCLLILPGRSLQQKPKCEVSTSNACPASIQLNCRCESQLCTDNTTGLYIGNCNMDPRETLSFITEIFSAVNMLEIDNAKLMEYPRFICDSMSNIQTLIIKNNHFSKIPVGCFSKLKELKYLELQNNQISTLDQEYFEGMEKLVMINISQNAIQEITSATWSSINRSSISMLDLSGNQLDETSIQPLRNKPLLNITRLHLYGNNFKCNCRNTWIKDWLIQNLNILVNPYRITCNNTATIIPSSILILNPETDFTCEDQPEINGTDTVIALAVSFIVILIALPLSVVFVCLVIYNKRRFVFEKTKWHPFDRDECQGEKKQHDVYISCARQCDDWVHSFLMQFLKSHNYKVTWHRELQTTMRSSNGKPFLDKITECVKQSKRTICLLSPDYLSDDISAYELKLSLSQDIKHKRRRTILINFEDDCFNFMNTSLKLEEDNETNLRKYTPLKRNSGSFKHDLLYCMPVNTIHEEMDDSTSGQISFEDLSTVDIPENVPMYDYF